MLSQLINFNEVISHHLSYVVFAWLFCSKYGQSDIYIIIFAKNRVVLKCSCVAVKYIRKLLFGSILRE